MSELDRALADVARVQGGLITAADVRRLGASPRTMSARAASGRAVRLAPRTYAVAGMPLDEEHRLRAVVLSTPGTSAVSHLAAARRYGLPAYRSAPPEITVPRGTRLHRPGVIVHESTDLDRCELRDVDGIPTTDPARMLLDLARLVGPKRLLRDIEWCRRRGLASWDDLVRTLVGHARRGRPGVRKLRQAIAANMHRRDITDTDVELLVLALLREHGLPEPTLHHRVYDGERFVAEVDLAYPERKIALECDGDVHLLPEVRERDLARQNDLELLGWLVLRFTSERYWRRPQSIVSEVRAAHRQRSPLA